jgi:hypothetical protein
MPPNLYDEIIISVTPPTNNSANRGGLTPNNLQGSEENIANSLIVIPPTISRLSGARNPVPPIAPPIITPLPATKVKQQAEGCPGLHVSLHTPLSNCGADDCTKQVHQICYEWVLKKSKKARTEHLSLEFCTFACQDKYGKTSGTSHLHWRNDGKNGTDDPQHSEHYIVQWLLTGDNFAKWRSPSCRQTKIKIAECAANLLNYGLKRVISAQMAYNKIMHIEGQM